MWNCVSQGGMTSLTKTRKQTANSQWLSTHAKKKPDSSSMKTGVLLHAVFLGPRLLPFFYVYRTLSIQPTDLKESLGACMGSFHDKAKPGSGKHHFTHSALTRLSLMATPDCRGGWETQLSARKTQEFSEHTQSPQQGSTVTYDLVLQVLYCGEVKNAFDNKRGRHLTQTGY